MAEERRSSPAQGDAGTSDTSPDAVRDALRRVSYPGYDRDIVSFGLVDEVEVGEEGVHIRLVLETGDEDVPDLLRRAIEEELRGSGWEPVDVEIRRPEGMPGPAPSGSGTGGTDASGAGSPAGTDRPMTPLQAELAEEGTLPEPDPLGRARTAPGTAPGAGYGAGGPTPLAGPGGVGQGNRADREAPGGDGRDVDLRVYQWEIDPGDEELAGDEAELEAWGWHFRIWWREHPEELVYASIQALRADPGSPEAHERPHPMGRAVAVNLVYDPVRGGVAAVYGTVRDFRPFVRAFEEVYGPASGGPGVGGGTDDADDTDISEGSQG